MLLTRVDAPGGTLVDAPGGTLVDAPGGTLVDAPGGTLVRGGAASVKAQQATRLVFFIAGFATASWAPLVPFVQLRCGLTDAALGLLLLCLGIGSIVAMPLAGVLSGRYGCRIVIAMATLIVCGTLPVLAHSASIAVLTVALIVFGAGVGSVDCIANVQAVIVERASGRAMMSGFHGLFSVGGIVGAGGVSALLSLGVSPLAASCGAVAVVVVALACAWSGVLARNTEQGGPLFAIPRGVVLLIGLMCFVVFLTEGSALDWSAVVLTTIRKMDLSHAGLGYVAFAAMMTVGRLSGDRLVRKFQRRRLIVAGGSIAAIGLWLIAAVPVWQVTLAGYAMVGAGCSNIVPILYTAVGRQQRMPEYLAVPAITTLGYSGILLGPAVIGFVAAGTSLPIALGAIAVLLIGVVVAGTRLKLV